MTDPAPAHDPWSNASHQESHPHGPSNYSFASPEQIQTGRPITTVEMPHERQGANARPPLWQRPGPAMLAGVILGAAGAIAVSAVIGNIRSDDTPEGTAATPRASCPDIVLRSIEEAYSVDASDSSALGQYWTGKSQVYVCNVGERAYYFGTAVTLTSLASPDVASVVLPATRVSGGYQAKRNQTVYHINDERLLITRDDGGSVEERVIR